MPRLRLHWLNGDRTDHHHPDDVPAARIQIQASDGRYKTFRQTNDHVDGFPVYVEELDHG